MSLIADKYGAKRVAWIWVWYLPVYNHVGLYRIARYFSCYIVGKVTVVSFSSVVAGLGTSLSRRPKNEWMDESLLGLSNPDHVLRKIRHCTLRERKRVFGHWRAKKSIYPKISCLFFPQTSLINNCSEISKQALL